MSTKKLVITDARKLHKDFVDYDEDGTPLPKLDVIRKYLEDGKGPVKGARLFDDQFEPEIEKAKKKEKAKAPKAEAEPKKTAPKKPKKEGSK